MTPIIIMINLTKLSRVVWISAAINNQQPSLNSVILIDQKSIRTPPSNKRTHLIFKPAHQT